MTDPRSDQGAAESAAAFQNALQAYQSRELAEAARLCDVALQEAPDNADLLHLMSAIQLDGGHTEHAVSLAHRASEAAPDNLAIRNGYAITLHRAGRSADAVEVLTDLAHQAPEAAEPLANLAMIHIDTGAWADALTAAEAALQRDADNVIAKSNAAAVYQRLGSIEKAAALVRSALQTEPEHPGLLRNLIGVLNYDPNTTHQEIADVTQRYWAAHPKPATAPVQPQPKPAGAKIHIGFLSPDFRSHPVGHFLLPVVKGLDANKFEITLYANQTEEDDTTHALRAHASGWEPVKHLSESDAAARIAADGVDLLIDLAGFSDDHRLDVMRLKPAPVQASWFGYVATTGLPEVDYIIADKHVWPPEDDRYFVEQPVRLPYTYFCFAPPETRVPVRPSPVASRGHITFGSLNNTVKLNSACLKVWEDILNAVPGSKLLLKAPQLSDPRIAARVANLCGENGVDQSRLTLLGRTSREEHLAAYNECDLILDPFPYGGGLTTAEAIWMGVPVVTLAGDRWVARAGVSILETAGLPQFIAPTVGAYRELAIKMAGDLDELASWRAALRPIIESSPLCNQRRYLRDVEVALTKMAMRAV